ncbi:hypothetical protein LCGC14_2575490, partial [marine sediment metagenome]
PRLFVANVPHGRSAKRDARERHVAVDLRYVVSQSDRWMRTLGAPAQLETQAGQEAWTPPVSGDPEYRVLLQSWTEDLEAQQSTASVILERIPK